MRLLPLPLPNLALLQLTVHGDARGFFVERFNLARFAELGLPTRFAQDNHSRSAPGVLRGLHYQTNPPQGKLISVVHGSILDVAVDIRAHSPTFGQHVAIELSDVNGKMLWIPPGFAHGFCVLGNQPADVLYKVDAPYTPSTESGLTWNDPDLAIPWPISDPIVSERDRHLRPFRQYRQDPVDWPR